MEKLLAILDLFRKGSAVSDPVAWKHGQIGITTLGGLFIAVAHVAAAFGHPLPLDQASADAIAGGIIAFVNCLLTVTTSDKIGLPPAASSGTGGGNDATGNSEPPATPLYTG